MCPADFDYAHLNAIRVGETCAGHGLQQRGDDNGTYWVLPSFEDMLMIGTDDNGNWAHRTLQQQNNFEKAIRTTLDSELDRYLTAMIDAALRAKAPEQS